MVFHVTLEKAEENWYIAECPALPGCVAQGKSKEEALSSVKEAIHGWLWAADHKAIESALPKKGRQKIAVTVE